jgi:hypothetical protein
VPVNGPQVGWAGTVGVGLVVGCVVGLTGDVGCVFGLVVCLGVVVVGVVAGIIAELSMFHVAPVNCGAGNCWTGSCANSASANVFQIRAGQ